MSHFLGWSFRGVGVVGEALGAVEDDCGGVGGEERGGNDERALVRWGGFYLWIGERGSSLYM